jgi:hypothetical protein
MLITFARKYLFRYYPFLLFFIFLSGTVSGYGQQKSASAIRAKFRKDSAYIYRPKKVMMLLSLDQRNTFLETSGNVNTPVDLGGIKVGLKIFDRHRTGLGYYAIRHSTAKVSVNGGAPLDVGFHFSYFTMFYEYYFIHTPRWDMGVPFEIGLGKYKTLGAGLAKSGTVVPLGTAIDLHYKPIRWISINGMGGYRQVVNNYSLVKLSNWFYAFGLSISTRYIYDDARFYLKKRRYKKDLEALRTRK